MLLRIIARLGVVALITSLLVVASPSSSQAARDFKPWGKVTSKNHVLKRGCNDYTYRYRVNAPTERWAAEIFVVGPRRTGLGSAFIDAAIDPKRGKRTITVCRSSAPYGKYRLKMKVTWQQDREITTGFVKPTTFRFVRGRR